MKMPRNRLPGVLQCIKYEAVLNVIMGTWKLRLYLFPNEKFVVLVTKKKNPPQSSSFKC